MQGSQTGVFAGVIYQDYGLTCRDAAVEDLEGYLATGSAGQCGVGSGGLHVWSGGSGGDGRYGVLVVAGGVASGVSGVASGECSLALAGGVTVMATPGVFVEFGRQRGLAR